ncbi:MAG: metallophosphoesterase [Acidobacteriota bacterium]
MPLPRLLHRNHVKHPRSLKQRDALIELTADLIERVNLEVEETYRFQIDRQDIIIPHLPDDFHGFTIAQLSDIHHSPYLSLEHLAKAVRETNALQPDVIVLTGDYVTHTARYVEPCAECLGRLQARFGVFAVLGNHDVWVGAAAVTQAFERHGIPVLNNTNLPLYIGGRFIYLCGLGDTTTRNHDLIGALKGTRRRDIRILLSHNPSIIKEASLAECDLVLSGHTHGGQVKLPVIGAPISYNRHGKQYTRGWAQMKKTQIYVNRGLGTIFLPIRYQCPPEISLLRLLQTPE